MALNSKWKPEMAKMAEFRELWECSGPVNQLVTTPSSVRSLETSMHH